MERGTISSGFDLDPQRQPHEDRQLGASVEAAHIFGGVRFGVASGLGGGQHGGELGALLHLAEDEVAGAVENAFDALDAVAGESLLQSGNDRDASGNRGAIFQMAAMGGGQALQFHTVEGDQFLVGGDYALACFERAPHPGAHGIQAAYEFHNHVRIGAEHRIDVLAPDDGRGGPVHPLSRHAAIEDMGQFQAIRLGVGQDPRHRTAYRAETEDGDSQWPQRLSGLVATAGKDPGSIETLTSDKVAPSQ